MSEWKTASLDQVGRIVTGKTPPTSEPGNYGNAISFVTPTDMDGRRIIDRTLRYLSERGANCVRSSILPEPAILVSCIGSDMGKAVITNGPCVTNQQINSIIVSGTFDRLYVYYNLSMRRDELRNIAGGAAQPILNKTDFGRLPIDYPPLAEQQQIASILGALDDKIELNRQMNETLEAMARAIFKDWFVDFGPTRAKMEGRAPYLAPEIWSLFPDRLDDEGKPKGWQLFSLEQIAEHCKGSVSPVNEPNQTFEHYSLPAFDNGQQPTANLGSEILSNKTPVQEGSVLLSKLNPETSRVWIPNSLGILPQVASTEFLVFKPKAPAGRGLLYCLFRDQAFKQKMEGMVTGTSKSHQRISPPALLRANVLCADQSLFHGFEKAISSILQRLLANRSESQTLAATRDLLLPKLMSGAIRVDTAAKIREDAF